MNPADTIIQESLITPLEPYGFQLVSESLTALDGLSPADRPTLARYAEQVQARLVKDKGLTLDIGVLALACLLHLRFNVVRTALSPDPMGAFGRYSETTAEWESRTYQVLYTWNLLSRMTKFAAYPPPVRAAFERLAAHHVLVIPPASASLLDVLRFLAVLRQQMQSVDGERFKDVWQELAPEDTHFLVDFAIAVHEADVFPDKYVANTMLARLACLVPDGLEPHHERIADAGICYPGVIFYGAGAAARDRLIERLRKRGNRTHVEIALAFIGDEEARKVVTPEIALEAGWEKTSSGEQRLLYYTDCFELVPLAAARQADATGPVAVIAPCDDAAACPCCRQPLMLLFDLDLRDPRLGFLRLSPRRTLLGGRSPAPDRLPMAIYPRCVDRGGVVYGRVDSQGRSIPVKVEGASPPSRNEQPTAILPKRKLVFGARCITPVQAARMAYAGTASQIGGFPLLGAIPGVSKVLPLQATDDSRGPSQRYEPRIRGCSLLCLPVPDVLDDRDKFAAVIGTMKGTIPRFLLSSANATGVVRDPADR